MIHPRVFVVQQPVRRLPGGGDWVPAFDISPAKKFGRIEFVLLKPGNISTEEDRFETILNHVRNAVKNYSDADFILPTGEPVAIAMVCMCAAQANNGRIRLLKWDKFSHAYETVNINIRK